MDLDFHPETTVRMLWKQPWKTRTWKHVFWQHVTRDIELVRKPTALKTRMLNNSVCFYCLLE